MSDTQSQGVLHDHEWGFEEHDLIRRPEKPESEHVPALRRRDYKVIHLLVNQDGKRFYALETCDSGIQQLNTATTVEECYEVVK